MHECPHVKDGIVGVHHVVCQLLDAVEVKLVFENQVAILSDVIPLESLA
jgi:hypothetical protein